MKTLFFFFLFFLMWGVAGLGILRIKTANFRRVQLIYGEKSTYLQGYDLEIWTFGGPSLAYKAFFYFFVSNKWTSFTPSRVPPFPWGDFMRTNFQARKFEVRHEYSAPRLSQLNEWLPDVHLNISAMLSADSVCVCMSLNSQ